MPKESSIKIFHKLCWFLVVYTVLVIIWGAWVRISHSGDGCGNHWPLCEGAYIPDATDKKTWIEYFHRLSSGLYGLLVIAMTMISFRIFPRSSAARQVAVVTFFLMIIEALLGAALVLKGLVGENATFFRLSVMTLHQMNSLLLTGSTVILSLVTAPVNNPTHLQISWNQIFKSGWNWIVFMIIPATGAWAALANTLFPSASLQEGFEKDFSPETPWILRLRVVHPFIAVALSSYLIIKFYKKSEFTKGELSKASFFVVLTLSVALIFGILTLLFLSPVWMKLVHLTIAQLVWISLVHYVMISLLSTKR